MQAKAQCGGRGAPQTLRAASPTRAPSAGEPRKSADLLHSSPTLSSHPNPRAEGKGLYHPESAPGKQLRLRPGAGLGWVGGGGCARALVASASSESPSEPPLTLPSGLGHDGHPCHLPSGVLLPHLYKLGLPLNGI